MTPYFMDEWLTVFQGDCRAVMASMEPESVQCVVTSPPYWGLRDYGTAGQLGLEPTPEAYVASMVEVFREVRRVLRDDGTLWLNLGDSYASNAGGYDDAGSPGATADGRISAKTRAAVIEGRGRRPPFGLKPKDLVGVPWRVAFALQQPYYAGRIAQERDRVWLAAMIDGEGSIDVNRLRADIRNRPRESFGTYVRVHNTSEAIVRRCAEIAGIGSVAMTDDRRQPVFVWSVYGDNARSVLREVYPYLVAKQQQARLAGDPCDETCAALRLLHKGTPTTVDRPAPAPCLEPGWYLRSDIIWSKPNPMPESVTDRPTKSHEYVFLLSKSERYYFDAAAVREADAGTDHPRSVLDGQPRPHKGLRQTEGRNGAGRNIRSVWTIATQPYPGAHFATFPPKLVEPCVKAGCPSGGTVLDPFAGSGTTGMVAQALGRRAILIDLNGDYLIQAMKRNAQSPLGLSA